MYIGIAARQTSSCADAQPAVVWPLLSAGNFDAGAFLWMAGGRIIGGRSREIIRMGNGTVAVRPQELLRSETAMGHGTDERRRIPMEIGIAMNRDL